MLPSPPSMPTRQRRRRARSPPPRAKPQADTFMHRKRISELGRVLSSSIANAQSPLHNVPASKASPRRRGTAGGVRGVGERWDGRGVAADDFCLLLPLLVRLLELNKTSVWIVCVSKILTDILFYVRDIQQSTRTISGTNHMKCCQ
jgi:hypothetical protein